MEEGEKERRREREKEKRRACSAGYLTSFILLAYLLSGRETR